MAGPRIGFVIGDDGFWRHRLLSAKQEFHRLKGILLPDVYALPFLLGSRCTFIRNGEPIAPSAFDLIFSELNGSDQQLEYLSTLVAATAPPVAVIPGPPEIISARLTDHKLRLVRRILLDAPFVLAYSDTIAAFCDGLIGQARSRVIPWPFDYDATRRLAGPATGDRATIRVVLNVPLRFDSFARNYPLVLKAALIDALAALPPDARQRFTFSAFVYEDQDAVAFARTGFADGLAVTLEPRRSFGSFVRFLGESSAVVNLTSTSVLGRVTFLAAALDKPGIFTANSEINQQLYPGSLVPLLAPSALRDALTGLLAGLAAGDVPTRFMPDVAAARRLGDFNHNAIAFARLFAALPARRDEP
jgi:hypothetical protein